MRKLLIFATLFILSCEKETIMPDPEIHFQVDNVTIPDIIPHLRYTQDQNQLTGSNQDESYRFEIDLGDEIKSQVFNPESIMGDTDPISANISSVSYYLIDSGGFSITISEKDGYYNGSFSGTLSNQSNNHIELSGSFNNL